MTSIAIEDGGSLIGTYSNGRSQKLAQVVLADFKGLDFLQRLDGGAYATTASSGAAVLGATGTVIGGSVTRRVRMTQRLSNHRRFLTEGRIVD